MEYYQISINRPLKHRLFQVTVQLIKALSVGIIPAESCSKRNPVGQTFCAASAGVYTYGESLLESHSHTTEDRDIIRLPRLFQFLQRPIAQLISVLRAPKCKEGYAAIGGGSPLLKITDEQAHAIKMALEAKGMPANVYVGMRYGHPFTEEAIHLSWYQREGYIRAMADLIEKELEQFSKPEEVCCTVCIGHDILQCTWNSSELCGGCSQAGDPYKDQMEECIFLIMRELKARGIDNDHTLAYQSRVGPAQWLKPYTDEVLVELGQKGVKSLLAVPVSFVSEHIETLEEIDMEDKHLALESGTENWGRVPALGCTPSFITDLADAVVEALPSAKAMSISKSTSQEADYDPLSYAIKMFFVPLSYAIKMFFGSILAFVLHLSPEMILAFRNLLF
ncbi:hypothetical protein GH714_030442 [Hevea brasiliensis]|uniref:Ferrochelatase n=1 Tax=Hevea brasiliensis TaxID=3981 RepID=A0A6A6LXG6_HEVBR|nr:hypothetical protein GH714_030442 [Hevea brasiliensis]